MAAVADRAPAERRAPLRERLQRATLSARVVAGTAALALIVAAVFGVLLYAVSTLDDATRRERHAKDVTASTLQLEKLVLDLETGVRGFVQTGKNSALAPWTLAQKPLPKKLDAFERLPQTPAQRRLARDLVAQINAYLYDYTTNVVELVREVPAATRTDIVKFEGEVRLEKIRRGFKRFLQSENAFAAKGTAAAERRTNEAIMLAVAGLIASAALIAGFGLYLARAIGRPVHDVAEGASRLAGGDLSTRLRPTGPAEVRELTDSFNRMAERLEQSRRVLELQNQRLRESERAKSELVSVVAHELRTPLASVLGFTSVLLQRDVTPEERRQYLGIIDAQGRRLASLVNDFLDVQRLDEGKLTLAQDLVDMGRIVREQTELFAGQSPNHLLKVSLPETPLAVRGDENRLSQVVGNLLSNAIKYSPDGGVVEIKGERKGERVLVRVDDEGIGIPQEVQNEIFGKFVRGHATAIGIEGSGLGLAISRSLVEAHGGRIDFASTNGEGSTFWFELPVAAPN
jgi:signal transduction histidine kinase